MDECWHWIGQVVSGDGLVPFDISVLVESDTLLAKGEVGEAAAFLTGVFNSLDLLSLMNLLLLQLGVQLVRHYDFLGLDNIDVFGHHSMRRF